MLDSIKDHPLLECIDSPPKKEMNESSRARIESRMHTLQLYL